MLAKQASNNSYSPASAMVARKTSNLKAVGSSPTSGALSFFEQFSIIHLLFWSLSSTSLLDLFGRALAWVPKLCIISYRCRWCSRCLLQSLLLYSFQHYKPSISVWQFIYLNPSLVCTVIIIMLQDFLVPAMDRFFPLWGYAAIHDFNNEEDCFPFRM